MSEKIFFRKNPLCVDDQNTWKNFQKSKIKFFAPRKERLFRSIGSGSRSFLGIRQLAHSIFNGQQYDGSKGVYRVNFSAKDIVLNDGSLAFTPTAFLKMRDRRVVKDGVAYKSGIRDVHAIKLFEPDNETRKSHMFALAFTSCPSVCDQCFSSFNRF